MSPCLPWNPAFTAPNSTFRRSWLPSFRRSVEAASFNRVSVSNGKDMKKTASGRNKACAFIRSHLISVAEKDIAGAASPDFQNHLDSCPECAFLVQRFARAWTSPAVPEETQATPSFFPGLIIRIKADEELRPGRRGVLTVSWRILRRAAVAAVFLGGIFAGYEMGKAGKNLPPPEESFAGRFLDSFENIPRGSVADFYVSRQSSKKEDLE